MLIVEHGYCFSLQDAIGCKIVRHKSVEEGQEQLLMSTHVLPKASQAAQAYSA